MTIGELIARLSEFPMDKRVMILDGFNAGGYPREINVGPIKQTVTKDDVENCADCEGLKGQKVVVIGYGCY